MVQRLVAISVTAFSYLLNGNTSHVVSAGLRPAQHTAARYDDDLDPAFLATVHQFLEMLVLHFLKWCQGPFC